MRADDFTEFRRFKSQPSAESVKALLESEGVDCLLDPSEPLETTIVSGGLGVRVLVKESQVHRAEFILRDSEFTDEELTYLATGELPREEG